MLRVLAIGSTFLVAGCVTPPRAVNPDDPIPYIYTNAECDNLSEPTQKLAQVQCRLDLTERTFAVASHNQDQRLQARNLVLFGAGSVAFTTLFLNRSGLSESQTEDMSELAVGAAILQASSLIYDPEELATVFGNAELMTRCYRDHVDRAVHLEASYENATQAANRLRTGLQTLRGQVDQLAEVEVSLRAEDPATADGLDELRDVEDVAQIAEDFLVRANQSIARFEDQVGRRGEFISQASQSPRRVGYLVRQRLRSGAIDLNEIMTSASSAAAAVADFEIAAAGEGQGVPEEKRSNSVVNSLATDLSSAQTQLNSLDQATPNYTALIASMDRCRGVLETGGQVVLPNLGGTLPESQTGWSGPSQGSSAANDNNVAAGDDGDDE